MSESNEFYLEPHDNAVGGARPANQGLPQPGNADSGIFNRHNVRIATHPAFKKFVEEDCGLSFFSVGGDPSGMYLRCLFF